MGAGNSIAKYDSFTSELFSDICLTNKDIKILSREFDRINICGSGKISRHEFYTTFGYEETIGIQKFFLMCSSSVATTLDFSDFVCLMWNFLTLELADVVPIIFHLYDTDETGTLAFVEIKDMIKEIHPVRYKNSNHLQRAVKRLESSYYMSLPDFREWTHGNPTVLMPFASLHNHLRKNICGEDFWLELERRRYMNMRTVHPTFIHEMQQKCTSARSNHLRELEEQRIKTQAKLDEKVEREKWRLLRQTTSGFGGKMKKSKSSVAVVPSENDIEEEGKEARDTLGEKKGVVGEETEQQQMTMTIKTDGAARSCQNHEEEKPVTEVMRSKSLRILQSLQSFATEHPDVIEKHEKEAAAGNRLGRGVGVQPHEPSSALARIRPLLSFASGTFQWMMSGAISSLNINPQQTDKANASDMLMRGKSEAEVGSQMNQDEGGPHIVDVMERFVKRKESLKKQGSSVVDRDFADASKHLPRPLSATGTPSMTPTVEKGSEGGNKLIVGKADASIAINEHRVDPIVGDLPGTPGAHVFNQHPTGTNPSREKKTARKASRPKSAGGSVRGASHSQNRQMAVSKQRSTAFNGVAYQSRSIISAIHTTSSGVSKNVTKAADESSGKRGSTTASTTYEGTISDTQKDDVDSLLFLSSSHTPLTVTDRREVLSGTPVAPRPGLGRSALTGDIEVARFTSPMLVVPSPTGETKTHTKRRNKEEKKEKKYPNLYLTSDGFLPFGPPKEEYGEWKGGPRQKRTKKTPPRHQPAVAGQRRMLQGHRLQPLVSGRPVFKPF